MKENLFINAHKIARSVGAEAITYICTSRNDQERVKRIGLHPIAILGYNYYLDENDNKIFTNLDSGQHYSILAGVDVGPRQTTSAGNWFLNQINYVDE